MENDDQSKLVFGQPVGGITDGYYERIDSSKAAMDAQIEAKAPMGTQTEAKAAIQAQIAIKLAEI